MKPMAMLTDFVRDARSVALGIGYAARRQTFSGLVFVLRWIAIALAVVSLSFASNLALSKTETEQECLARTTDESSYAAAVNLVVNLPIVKTWIDQMGQQRRMALGKHIDKTEFVSGRCYWSLSLFESGDEQLRLWNIFRVSINGRRAYRMNADGTYVPINIPLSHKSN